MSHMDEFVNQGAPGISADRLNEPFHLKSVTYDQPNNRLALVIGRGRARFLDALVVANAEQTVYIAAPAINTTYYLYLKSDGTFISNTTGVAPAGCVQLWSVTTGAALANPITKADRRGLVEASGRAAQDNLNTHKGAAVLDHPDGSVTTAKIANGAVTAAKVAADVATQAELDAHTGRTDNPHGVTAAQLGAVALLAQIETVDGAGSGLDSDLFQGQTLAQIIARVGGFGDGSDGVFNSAGNVTFAVGADDGGPVVKQYTSFTLNAGHTLTVDRRCKGLIILCQGNIVINGTISMDNLAARVARSYPGRPWIDFADVGFISAISKGLVNLLIPAGGNGGAGGNATGSGGATSYGGAGGAGAAFGGSGGGGGGASTSPLQNGANGGVGAGPGAAGGAAFSTVGAAGTAGGPGGGGIIVLLAKGSITVGATGLVTAKSTSPGGNGGAALANGGAGSGGGGAGNGGAGLTANYGVGAGYTSGGGGGGGAGGGVVAAVAAAGYTNNGSINVNGSAGGTGATSSLGSTNYAGQNGASGQTGSIFAGVM